MNGVQTAGVGNLTRDPELRFTNSGIAWVTFSVAVNKSRGADRDPVTTFLNCKAWREIAENIAESFKKGDRVFVTGTLETEEWNDRDGNKRTSPVLLVDDCGPSVRWATVSITRNERTGGGGGGGGRSGGGYGGGGGQSPSVPAEDAGHDPFGMPAEAAGDGEAPF
jgi:single-strand DNA-binding protein